MSEEAWRVVTLKSSCSREVKSAGKTKTTLMYSLEKIIVLVSGAPGHMHALGWCQALTGASAIDCAIAYLQYFAACQTYNL